MTIDRLDLKKDQFAKTHGLHFVKMVFDNHAHFKRSNRMRRSPDSNELDLLSSDQNVNWFEHQTVKSRQKRDFVANPSPKIAKPIAPKVTPYKGTVETLLSVDLVLVSKSTKS